MFLQFLYAQDSSSWTDSSCPLIPVARWARWGFGLPLGRQAVAGLDRPLPEAKYLRNQRMMRFRNKAMKDIVSDRMFPYDCFCGPAWGETQWHQASGCNLPHKVMQCLVVPNWITKLKSKENGHKLSVPDFHSVLAMPLIQWQLIKQDKKVYVFRGLLCSCEIDSSLARNQCGPASHQTLAGW